MLEKRTPCVVQGLWVDQVIITKIWKIARIVNVMFIENSRKICRFFKLKFFSCYFSLCFFCVHYLSFTLLTIIITTKGQRTHVNKVSNINKIINITSWRNQDKTPYWIFRKLYKSFMLFGVISQSLFPLVTYKITFASFRYLHSHKAQTSLWCCWVIWLSATTGYQKQTDLTCTFSQ